MIGFFYYYYFVFVYLFNFAEHVHLITTTVITSILLYNTWGSYLVQHLINKSISIWLLYIPVLVMILVFFVNDNQVFLVLMICKQVNIKKPMFTCNNHIYFSFLVDIWLMIWVKVSLTLLTSPFLYMLKSNCQSFTVDSHDNDITKLHTIATLGTVFKIVRWLHDWHKPWLKILIFI